MHKVLLVGIGSCLGGISRYWLSTMVHSFASDRFPCGTVFVNSLGCFLMGFLFILLIERFDSFKEYLRALLLIGFLGGFTTFSTFSLDTVNLVGNDQMLHAITNVMVSIFLCLGLTLVGILLGRQLSK